MQHGPAEQEENHHSTPENPLILTSPPFHHTNRISTHPQRIRHAIESALGTLQHLPLLTEVRQHGATPIEEIVELVVRVGKEGLFAQGVRFTSIIGRSRAEAETGGRRCKGRGRGERGLGIWVLRGGGVVGTATE